MGTSPCDEEKSKHINTQCTGYKIRHSFFSLLAIAMMELLAASLIANAQTYSVPHNFTGGYPVSDVVMDSAGDLYGTATVGGSTVGSCYQGLGCGVAWKITP